MPIGSWKTLSTKICLDTPYITVKKNIVVLPSGIRVDDYYTVIVQDSSAIVAITESNEIILIKQYRYCYDKELIELPSGVFEKDALAVAKRELLEETGYQSVDWTYLGSIIENPAKMTNHNHLFFARNCVKVADQKLDESEIIEVLKIPFDNAIAMVMNNDILGSSTAHGILKVARIMNR